MAKKLDFRKLTNSHKALVYYLLIMDIQISLTESIPSNVAALLRAAIKDINKILKKMDLPTSDKVEFKLVNEEKIPYFKEGLFKISRPDIIAFYYSFERDLTKVNHIFVK